MGSHTRIGAVAAVALALVGCTSSGGATPSTPVSTTTIVQTSAPPTAAISAGPTTVAAAPSCPYVSQDFVRQTIGMRLSTITVLRSGGKVIGCRFYALQNDPLAVSENLPGANQPVVEIVTRQFPSATAAHNAFVVTGEQGTNYQQTKLGSTTGLCYQTEFYPRDHGTDYACTVSKGSTQLIVRSVDTTDSLSPSLVTAQVLGAL